MSTCRVKRRRGGWGFPTPLHRKRDRFFFAPIGIMPFECFSFSGLTLHSQSFYLLKRCQKRKVCVGELHRPVYDNRVATHHLMDIFFFESKTSRPSVRPVRQSTFVQFGSSARDVSCTVHMYIHTSQLGSADRFSTDPVSSLSLLICLLDLHMCGLRRVD